LIDFGMVVPDKNPQGMAEAVVDRRLPG